MARKPRAGRGTLAKKKQRTAETILRDLVATLELMRQSRAADHAARCRSLAEKLYQELHEVDCEEKK